MAYTNVKGKGYNLAGFQTIDAIVDSSSDYGSVPNNEHLFDKNEQQVFFKDSNGTILSSFPDSVISKSSNSTTLVEVAQESDFGTAVGGVITLTANTTYIIRGEVTCSNRFSVVNNDITIMGYDRNRDKIKYTGSATLFTITDVDFNLRSLGITSDPLTTCKIIEATNYTAGVPANNYGRTKVIQIFGCEFRNLTNVMTITGFELVDLNNTLCWYVRGSIGWQFKDVRHLEMSSCELFNWFDEPTGSIYSTASMVELLANGVDNVGFAVVNINSSIIHPEQTQVGFNVNSLSTTSFGTIASNTFIDVGVTSGGLFLPVVSGLPDYSQTYTNTYDVMSNQGLLNSTSGAIATMVGNSTTTSLSARTPVIVAVGTGGSAPTLQSSVRFTLSATGRLTYTATKQIYVSIHCTLSYQKQGGGIDPYAFYFYKNGSQLAGSQTNVETATTGSSSLVYGVLMAQNDYIELYVENLSSNDDIIVSDFQLLIRE